jgi:hypothetical protein
MIISKIIRKDLFEVFDVITEKYYQVHISRIIPLVIPPGTRSEEIIKLAGVDHTEYFVESIINHRGDPRKKKSLEFLVRWQGYEPSDDTWEPYSNVRDLLALDEYAKQHPELNL